jgi:membrane-bound lytic murein transglycosylase A
MRAPSFGGREPRKDLRSRFRAPLFGGPGLRILAISVLVLGFLSGCAARIEKTAPPPAKPPVVKPVPPPAVPAAAPKAAVAPAFPPQLPGASLPPAAAKPHSALVPAPSGQVPLFEDDMDLASLDAAIEKSLRFYGRAAGSASLRGEEAGFPLEDLRESLLAIREIVRSGEPDSVRQRRIRDTFDVYRSSGLDGQNTVLFTGYFEPILEGSLKRTERFRYPIYRAPEDAVRVNLGKFGEAYPKEQLVGRVKNGELIPYYRRSEIDDQGALAGRNIEMVWVESRIDLFFLHVQGSGKIRLPNGELLQIGFALRNGHPYRSVGRHLLDTGRIRPQDASHRAIKKYLRENPKEMSEILNHNESYIFFRVVEQGPVGSIGEILTPGRSIATDASVFPRGALAFIRARKPVFDPEGNVVSWVPFTRFVLSQDAGSAIKGPGRVDLFCGTGEEAEGVAGSLAEKGELYFLVKKRQR